MSWNAMYLTAHAHDRGKTSKVVRWNTPCSVAPPLRVLLYVASVPKGELEGEGGGHQDADQEACKSQGRAGDGRARAVVKEVKHRNKSGQVFDSSAVGARIDMPLVGGIGSSTVSRFARSTQIDTSMYPARSGTPIGTCGIRHIASTHAFVK